MEEELSSLQLTTDKDLQSPTITSRRQESRMETGTSLEEEQRGDSSQPSHRVRESAEQHERLESQDRELETLQRLAKDLDRRLTQQKQSTICSSDPVSGFYPTPYVERGRPITPGVATGPEMYPPEARFNNFPVGCGNAYGIFPNGPGFYSPPGYAQYAYPFGVPNTPYPEIYRHSRSDNAYGACPNVVTHPSQAEMQQVHQVLPGQQQTIDFHRRPEEEKRQATERPIVQFCDGANPENTVARPDF